MTTEDVASNRTGAASTRSRRLRASALAVTAAFVLSACGAPDGYVDAYWDNGDPIYAPLKANLFDEDGVPTCNAPLAANGFESRARAYDDVSGGLINLFLFEIKNTEPDPNEPLTGLNPREEERERTRRERMQGSLDTMYQMTHPDFDRNFGVLSAEDLAPIKAELVGHLRDLDPSQAPISSYVERSLRWLDTPDGRLELSSILDVAGFIAAEGLPLEFDGLNFEYLLAIDQGGDEFLMVTDKDTAASVLYAGDVVLEVDESSESFTLYQIVIPGFGGEPSATITLVYDQCPPQGDSPTGRFWIYDYEILFPVAVEPEDDGIDVADEDEADDDA